MRYQNLVDYFVVPLSLLKENKKICNYLDIPLQHGSSKILKIMRRGTSREKSEELIHRIREIIPNIVMIITKVISKIIRPRNTPMKLRKMDKIIISGFTMELN